MKITAQKLSTKQGRKQLFRYWILDPVFGSMGFFLHYFLRFVPMRANSWIGAQLGKLVFNVYLTKEARRAKHNLSLLKPELSQQEIDQLANKMWENIGQTFCEYSILDKLWDKGRVQGDDSEAIDYIMSGKPVIFTAVHLGNWEAQASYVHAKNIPLMAMYKPVRNRFSRKISAIARKRMNILTIPTDAHAVRKMYRHLENNGAIWLPIDDLKKGQVHFPRFGRPLALKGVNAAHIIRMAKRFDAAVIPVQIKRINKPPPSFYVKAHAPMLLTDKSEQGTIDFLNKLDNMCEEWIRECPEQWFMLHDLRL